jgi:hypothetical protein
MSEYEITFAGRAGTVLRAEFDDCEVTIGPDTTTHRAELPDPAALAGLMQRIAALRLEVVYVRLVASPPEQLPVMRQRHTPLADVGRFIQAVRDSDEAVADDAVMRLSRARPWLAPFALAIGAFAMLFDGVKLLFTSWRLTLIQVLPAMCIWAAMLDLKLHLQPVTRLHLVHGRPFSRADGTGSRDPGRARRDRGHRSGLLPERRVRVRDHPARPPADPARIHPGSAAPARRAGIGRGHRPASRPVGGGRPPLGGVLVRAFPRHRHRHHDGLLRDRTLPDIGINPARSRRDKLVASAVGGAVGAVVCTPPHALGRIGLVMLGWGRVFFVLGVIVFAVALTLQAGATGAVKMSAKLVVGRKAPDSQALSGDVQIPRGGSGSSP